MSTNCIISSLKGSKPEAICIMEIPRIYKKYKIKKVSQWCNIYLITELRI